MNLETFMLTFTMMIFVSLLSGSALAQSGQTPANTARHFRPPAVPLVTCDPYFSVWSMSDRLTDDWTKHWTGANQAFVGMVRIDGKTFRIMGPSPRRAPAMPQVSLEVFPTRTMYTFDTAGVNIVLTFMTPMLPDDLELVSRPVTYLTWEVRSTDGKKHAVSLYYDNSAEIAVNTSDQKVVWSRYNHDQLNVLRIGTQEQRVLEKSGDDLRIDWGYFTLAFTKEIAAASVVTNQSDARESFVKNGTIPTSDDLRMPRPANDEWPVMALVLPLGDIGAEAVSRHIILAYDDLRSIEYFERKLRPYWQKGGVTFSDLLTKSEKEYSILAARCKKFDEEVTHDLAQTGGSEYAQLASLAYRQCLAAQKLALDLDGTPLLFPKENFSNGCISTVDVLYPASPMLLFFNTKLLRASLTPVLQYAETDRWHFPYAPHDLGTYPLANGQVYGGGEKTEEYQMPVEESGNMLLMVAAMAKIDGTAEYAAQHWKILTQWAEYLREKGSDPENQLCTDDFAGHLAHNANLSIKAILGLDAYAMLCAMTGKQDEANRYRKIAQQFAGEWMKRADDGDHFRLAFDVPGSWSQKYNLVWDKILGLNLFPREVAQKEVSYYLTKQNRYGLPLDNRKSYTKLDWITWTATLADNSKDFAAFIAPLYKFMNESPSRVPLTDWFETTDAKQVAFQARSVVGGVYIKMLSDPAMWKKWSGKGK